MVKSWLRSRGKWSGDYNAPRSFGVLQGHTFEELEAKEPEQAYRWRKRDPAFAPEGGESLIALRERITTTTHALAAQHVGGQIVLVAHGGVLDCLYRAAARLALDAPRTWQLGNAAINRVLFNGEGFVVIGWNDHGHLEGLGDDAHA